MIERKLLISKNFISVFYYLNKKEVDSNIRSSIENVINDKNQTYDFVNFIENAIQKNEIQEKCHIQNSPQLKTNYVIF